MFLAGRRAAGGGRRGAGGLTEPGLGKFALRLGARVRAPPAVRARCHGFPQEDEKLPALQPGVRHPQPCGHRLLPGAVRPHRAYVRGEQDWGGLLVRRDAFSGRSPGLIRAGTSGALQVISASGFVHCDPRPVLGSAHTAPQLRALPAVPCSSVPSDTHLISAPRCSCETLAWSRTSRSSATLARRVGLPFWRPEAKALRLQTLVIAQPSSSHVGATGSSEFFQRAGPWPFPSPFSFSGGLHPCRLRSMLQVFTCGFMPASAILLFIYFYHDLKSQFRETFCHSMDCLIKFKCGRPRISFPLLGRGEGQEQSSL